MKRLKKQQKLLMNIVYAGEELPKKINSSIFLAGPTPRSGNVKSWRNDALNIFEELGYNGTIFIPEPRDGKTYPDYSEQIDWEEKMLNACDCILFWIPRQLRDDFEMLALTTNIEWGKYQNSGKIVMGFPENAKHIRYINFECEKLGIKCCTTLDETIKEAINFIGDGAVRENGECYIPLNIWTTPMFEAWYNSQKNCGNSLVSAKVNYVFKMPKTKKTFLWILHANVYIKDEDRIKDNEFVVARTDICSAVLYRKGKTLEDTEVVLIKEFRTPVRNSQSYVYEIPGGSSMNDKDDNLTIIQHEIVEETGITLEKNRFKFIESRQLMATLSSHQCHLYTVELSNDEMDELKSHINEIHGVEEDTEKTYLQILTINEILTSDLLDWSNLGMILSVLKNE